MTAADLLDKLAALITAGAGFLAQARPTVGVLVRLVRRDVPAVSYENLALEIVLDIQDPEGKRAILERRQQIRFLTADRVVVRDLVWGEGKTLARYHVTGARRLAVQPDGSHHAVLLDPTHHLGPGQQARITSRRVIAGGFLTATEYLEAMTERPTERLLLQVRFPAARPPREAFLVTTPVEPTSHRIALRYGRGGRPALTWRCTRPVAGQTYSLRWSW